VPPARARFLLVATSNPSIVMPAKAGIHNHRPVFVDSGFRRNDNQRKTVIPNTGKLL
jgi:hypothetical protein